MLQAIQSKVYRFFNKGHERTLKTKRNIARSVFIKGGSVVASLLIIPLTINYINAAQYGIWLTLSSIITWAALFDMGLGNGLKNKLTECIALNDMQKARSYVSSTYAVLLIISLLLFTVFYLVNPYINWQKILNAPEAGYNLNVLVLIVFGSFCIQFIIQLINTVLTADQNPAKAGFISLAGQVFTLLAIALLVLYVPAGLMNVVLAFVCVPMLVVLISSIWLYNRNYKAIAPALRFVKLKYAWQMLSAGSSFFIIQIAALVLYETDNIVIIQLFGPKEVTTFNIAYKLFSIVLMFFVVVITPFWSAFAEAFTKQDMDWIKRAIDKANRLWLGLSLCSVLLLLLSPWLYRLWLGNAVTIPFSLSLAMCVYAISMIWQAIHVQLINGTGKILFQLYLGIVASVVNIPLAIWLGRRIGLAGVTWSNIIVFVAMGVCFSIQTRKIINGTAKGIFNA